MYGAIDSSLCFVLNQSSGKLGLLTHFPYHISSGHRISVHNKLSFRVGYFKAVQWVSSEFVLLKDINLL